MPTPTASETITSTEPTLQTLAWWNSLAEKAMQGELLTREEAHSVLDCSDDELLNLLAATARVRRAAFGNVVQLYYLKNAKSGLCPEDCGYCSQSKVSEAEIPKYVFQNEEKLLAGAKAAADSQARTYCIVASGRGPTDREVDHVCRTVEKIKGEYGLHICCCLGILTPEHAAKLKEAGVDRINHNLNTSENFHEEICSTHTYRDRIETLKTARDAGMELCAGMIVGMGETHNDVIDVAMELRELNVESIPINFLNPIDGTPMEGVAISGTEQLNPRYCIKALCLFRLIHPRTELRIAGGRELQIRSLQPMALYAANSMFVSDYLTTKGQEASADYAMVRDLGFEIVTQVEGEG